MFFIIYLVFYFYSSNTLYNNLKIINNFKSSSNSFSIKIPSKMKITNKYLGNTDIDDSLIMNDVLQYCSNITSCSSSVNDVHINNNNNVVTVSGTIFYSNGNSENFIVNNTLELGNNTYYGNSYYINTLRNTLFNCIYTYKNIINIINDNSSKVVYTKDNSIFVLDETQKNNLVSCLSNFNLMEDNKDFLQTNLNENPNFTLKVFITGSDNYIASNTIYLIIYRNYLVIQYLGDENGKNIYIKGELNEENFK